MQVDFIPAFDDNYIWVLSHQDQVALVDPGDAEPTVAYLQAHGLRLSAVLVTHRHSDHTGGIKTLKKAWPDAQIYGPAHELISGLDNRVADGAQVNLAELGLSFTVMELPGHTEGHVAYFGEGALFCGDVLFTGGCGRVFTGTYEQMSDSLQRIAKLPPETLIYCAHEYTQGNLGFANLVEPQNPAVQQRREQTRLLRSRHLPTVPAPLSLELATNPFLRTQEPSVIAAAERWSGRALENPAQVFHVLRDWKDRDYD